MSNFSVFAKKSGDFLLDTGGNTLKSIIRSPMSVFNKYTGAGLTGAEIEANAFAAEQAETAWNRSEISAQNERAWQEQFYQDYQSPSALMRQYADVGLNPALMYGQGVSPDSPPSSPAGSASAASSVTPSSGSNVLQDFLSTKSMISQVRLQSAQAKEAEARAHLAESQTAGQDITNQDLSARLKAQQSLTEVQVQECNQAIEYLKKQIEVMDSEKEKNKATAALQTAESYLVGYQAITACIDSDFRYQMNELEVQLKSAEVSLRRAQTNGTYQQIQESKQRCKNMTVEYAKTFYEAVNANLNSGVIAAEQLLQLERLGLVKKQGEMYQSIADYNEWKQKLDKMSFWLGSASDNARSFTEGAKVGLDFLSMVK